MKRSLFLFLLLGCVRCFPQQTIIFANAKKSYKRISLKLPASCTIYTKDSLMHNVTIYRIKGDTSFYFRESIITYYAFDSTRYYSQMELVRDSVAKMSKDNKLSKKERKRLMKNLMDKELHTDTFYINYNSLLAMRFAQQWKDPVNRVKIGSKYIVALGMLFGGAKLILFDARENPQEITTWKSDAGIVLSLGGLFMCILPSVNYFETKEWKIKEVR